MYVLAPKFRRSAERYSSRQWLISSMAKQDARFESDGLEENDGAAEILRDFRTGPVP